jgi:hypothetical protein
MPDKSARPGNLAVDAVPGVDEEIVEGSGSRLRSDRAAMAQYVYPAAVAVSQYPAISGRGN